ncbi:hypothetical protein C8F04DRAFT_1230801, partial [Mycena alexandri]
MYDFSSGCCNPRDTWDTTLPDYTTLPGILSPIDAPLPEYPWTPDYPGITPCLIKDGPPADQGIWQRAAWDEDNHFYVVHGEASEPVSTIQDRCLAAFPDPDPWFQNQAVVPVPGDPPTTWRTSSTTRTKLPVSRTATKRAKAPVSRSRRSQSISKLEKQLQPSYGVPLDEEFTVASTSHASQPSSLLCSGVTLNPKRKREVESESEPEEVVRAPKRSKLVKDESPSPSLPSSSGGGVRWSLRPRAGKPNYTEGRDDESQSAGSSYSPGPSSDRATSVPDVGVAEAKTRGKRAPSSARQNPPSSCARRGTPRKDSKSPKV